MVQTMLLCMLCFCISVQPVFAADASEAEGIGTSMYDVSTALTAYANSVVGSNTNDKHPTHELTEMIGKSPGIAGAYVGYGDADNGFYGTISSVNAKAITTSSYDAWKNVGDEGATYAYLRYAYLLNDLGLDATAPEGQNGVRGIFGGLMWLIHACASMISQVFGVCLSLLNTLNPFRFFYGTGPATSSFIDSKGQLVETTVHLSGVFDYAPTLNEPTGIMKDLSKLVAEAYTGLQSIGIFVIIPLMLVFLLFSLLATRQAGKGRKIITFLQRFAFIIIGIPVCGALYTAALDSMVVLLQDEPAASVLVGSTYMDFEDWALEMRLGLPNNVQLKSVGKGDDASTSAGAADVDTFRSVRHSIFELNRAIGLVEGTNPIGITNDTEDIDAGMWDTDGLKGYSDFGVQNEDAMSKRVNALLSRYQSGARYQASSWESGVNGLFNQQYKNDLGATPSNGNAASNDGKIYGMFANTDQAAEWLDRSEDDNKKIFSRIAYDNGGAWAAQQWNIFSNGTLGVSTSNDNMTFYGNVSRSNGLDPKNNGGLSSLAMYNYLSSDFTASSVSVHSAKNSTSSYVKPSHFAVNMAGSGLMNFIYGANCIAVLGVFVILSLVYALGMVISNLKRGVHLIMQVPGAMLGVLRSVVQVIVYTVVMIMELLGTMFVYVFITQLIIMFATIIEKPVTDVVKNASVVIGGNLASLGFSVSADTLRQSVLAFGIGMIAVIFGILFCTKRVVKMRRSVLVAYEYVWCCICRMMTCEALLPAFDAWMAERKSLYVYDVGHVQKPQSVCSVVKELCIADSEWKEVNAAC